MQLGNWSGFICSNINIRTLLASAHSRYNSSLTYELEAGLDRRETLSKDVIPYKHHSNILQVRDHADTCDFCAMIWAKLVERLNNENLYDPDSILRGEEPVFVLYVGAGEMKVDFGYHMFPCFVTALGWEDDPLANLLSRVLPKNSGSPECLSKAREWLMTCQAEHPDCHRLHEGSFSLPTRVLDVGSDGINPSLYESGGKGGEWAALSYCWGGESEFLLKEETYHRLIEGLPLESFPATIRDAIVTTRAMGISYLWVDALCIKQDSRSDWETEAPKMSYIYTNAVLTIVNAAQDSTRSGIFRDRDDGHGNGTWEASACYLPWKRDATGSNSTPHTDADLEQEFILLREGGSRPTEWAGPGPDNCVWASRGWTLQEDLLSWRTLTFMHKELLWSCPSIQVWESGPPRAAPVDFSKSYETQAVQRVSPNLGHFPMKSTEKSLPGLRTLKTPEIYSAWYTMVENYSKRKLTKDTDKLMAIHGLEKEVQTFIVDNYCVGLWQNDLIAGLMWTWDSEPWGAYDDWGRLFPNSDSGLPSWSWASINNEVEWHWKSLIEGDTRQGNIAAQRKTVRIIELAKIEDVRIGRCLGIDSCELVMTAPTYNWSLVDEEYVQTWPEFHAILSKAVIGNDEFRARHQERPGQTFLVQQLVQVENEHPTMEKRTSYADFVPGKDWALLVLETVGEQELQTFLGGEEIVCRRVCLLFWSEVTRQIELLEQPTWPMKTLRIV
ncbi:HET-domain-containing protein [Acephala macrosclerotiorum]|nr:HET-domain-containing protein [Acephala macrosclerotiorum]